MVTYGADPDETTTKENPDLEWLLGNSTAGYVTKGGKATSGPGWSPNPRHPVEHLIWRFRIHPKQTMHSVMDDTHRAILGRQFSKLLKSGYEMDDLERLIDSYWETPSAQRSGTPVLPFCNKAFQRKLLAGTFVKTTDSVLQWIAGSFAPRNDLPWDDVVADDYKRLIMIEGLDALYSYPEIVADILTLHEDPTAALREFTEQLHWNWKQVDSQSTRLLELVPTVPAEIMKRGKARIKQASLSDAIAKAQGA
jgi:hypothetical protein